MFNFITFCLPLKIKNKNLILTNHELLQDMTHCLFWDFHTVFGFNIYDLPLSEVF